MALTATPQHTMLGPDDPPPFEVVNPDSNYPVVLVCEHAGRRIPTMLGDMGLSQDDLKAHIAWDIGAEPVARHMAEMLGATLVLQRYSRLVIDCNRPPESETAMPVISDGVSVPANSHMPADQKRQRIDEIFTPYQTVVDEQLAKPTCKAVLSIHSFTRTMAGQYRPWDIGFLFRDDTKTSHTLARAFEPFVPAARIGLNEPYQIDDESDWFVPRHGEAKNLPHSLIEICNDQIADAAGQSLWAGWLAQATREFVEKDLK
ncbi:N-formylglutamate amidohydrolase [Neptunicoccus cionae]|uniref:N-formylglutamate amidohydrolase n=1 Tax=Neptunicoccus cionae TaxID=2035344 RepID=A0A916VRX8_9RHOB|nr:N-formylglutamate amidohydrolase [Amylibacter cionae]GGA26589.1 N-formylglutamate amidohydrolase [Amylibacter cionae]